MGEIILETERLVLRQIGENDVDAHHAALNTPAVMRHLGGVMPRAAIAERHAKARRMYADHGFGFLLMIEQASGALVGHAGIKWVDAEHAPNRGEHEIGWLVREDRWRMGYAREAMGAVIDWAFAQVGAPHLVALTCDANEPSWRLMERLGMERRPDLDFDDPAYPRQSNPVIQYALTAARWAELKEAKP